MGFLLVAAGACSKPSDQASSVKPTDPAEATKALEPASPTNVELLNVSYDPTRELWRDVNEQFTKAYEKETGVKVSIKQSHGGSSTQARRD